jgi:hypothetical protein
MSLFIDFPLKRFVYLLGISAIFLISPTGYSQTVTSKALASGAIEVPRYLHTTNEIGAYFDQHHVPAELSEVRGKNENYCFVLAHPYSGVDTTDLYCFVKAGDGWGMLLKTYLWKTPFRKDVEFKADGDFVDVICKGVVVLKINPPK